MKFLVSLVLVLGLSTAAFANDFYDLRPTINYSLEPTLAYNLAPRCRNGVCEVPTLVPKVSPNCENGVCGVPKKTVKYNSNYRRYRVFRPFRWFRCRQSMFLKQAQISVCAFFMYCYFVEVVVTSCGAMTCNFFDFFALERLHCWQTVLYWGSVRCSGWTGFVGVVSRRS